MGLKCSVGWSVSLFDHLVHLWQHLPFLFYDSLLLLLVYIVT